MFENESGYADVWLVAFRWGTQRHGQCNWSGLASLCNKHRNHFWSWDQITNTQKLLKSSQMWLKSLRMVMATSVSTSLSGWWPGYTQTEKNQVKKKNKFYIKIYCLYWFLMKDRELCKMWFNVWMNNQNQSPKASIVSSQFFFISQGVQRLRHRGRSPRGVPSFWQRGGWIYYNSGFSRGFCSCNDENWSWWNLPIVPSPNGPTYPSCPSCPSINMQLIITRWCRLLETFFPLQRLRCQYFIINYSSRRTRSQETGW